MSNHPATPHPGLTGEASITVTARDTAASVGNTVELTVLSTPHLLLLVEMACGNAVQAVLRSDQRLVGTAVTLKHLAPTPIGERVTARVTLREVDGPRLVFAAVIDDEHERVGEARMESFVIDLDRFQRRVREKQAG